VQSPDDRVWYAFMLIAVVMASLFFALRTAALVAAAIFTALCLLPIWILELRSPARLLPVLALHGVLSPLLLIAARHHAGVERDSRAELARREARLAELERRDEQARSAAHVAHDLNNLITVVDANLAHLDQHYVQGQSEVVRETRTAIERICALTRDLSAPGSGRAERTSTFDPHEVIRDIRPLLAQIAGPDVDVVVGPATGRGQVRMDPLRLEQVLMNLIANARELVTQSGGKVSVSSEPGRGSRFSIFLPVS
jgi:signal transduction histidine kinase